MTKGIIRVDKEICKNHGAYDSEITVIFGREIGTMCPGCEKENKEKERIEEQKEKESEYKQSIEKANIPLRFRESSFNNYVCNTEKQKEALKKCLIYSENIMENIKKGNGLFLCGTYGTGKTHLAISILKELIKKNGVGVYVKTMSMLRDIRSSYQRESKHTEQQIIDKYVYKGLLVLDEVGVQYGTENEKLLIFDVINGRYENYKPTIIISNLSVKEVKEYLSERVFDRLRGDKESLVIFDWESHRRNNRDV